MLSNKRHKNNLSCITKIETFDDNSCDNMSKIILSPELSRKNNKQFKQKKVFKLCQCHLYKSIYDMLLDKHCFSSCKD
jgi:hypothetical protein